jgi:hypothetical protein
MNQNDLIVETFLRGAKKGYEAAKLGMSEAEMELHIKEVAQQVWG